MHIIVLVWNYYAISHYHFNLNAHTFITQYSPQRQYDLTPVPHTSLTL